MYIFFVKAPIWTLPADIQTAREVVCGAPGVNKLVGFFHVRVCLGELHVFQ